MNGAQGSGGEGDWGGRQMEKISGEEELWKVGRSQEGVSPEQSMG